MQCMHTNCIRPPPNPPGGCEGGRRARKFLHFISLSALLSLNVAAPGRNRKHRHRSPQHLLGLLLPHPRPAARKAPPSRRIRPLPLSTLSKQKQPESPLNSRSLSPSPFPCRGTIYRAPRKSPSANLQGVGALAPTSISSHQCASAPEETSYGSVPKSILTRAPSGPPRH